MYFKDTQNMLSFLSGKGNFSAVLSTLVSYSQIVYPGLLTPKLSTLVYLLPNCLPWFTYSQSFLNYMTFQSFDN